MNYLIEKLLFKDIQTGGSVQSAQRIQSAKRIALTVIAIAFIAGALLTTRHALDHYGKLKTAFFAETELVEPPALNNPEAVWFTKEEGDPHNIQGIIAYLAGFESGQLTLDIANVNDIPVELISVQDKDGKYEYPISQNQMIQPSKTYTRKSFTIGNVDARMLAVRSEIYVNYTYDDNIVRQALVVPFQRLAEDTFHGTAIRTTDNTHLFDFISEDDQFIFFNGEKIVITQPLFIPNGKTLRVFAGQELDLVNESFIVVHAPVLFEGIPEQPIHIHTSDSTGRGLLVTQADGKSTLSHVIFDGLDTPASGVWELTGAVTFYESDVDIAYSQFINNTSEDGLNIIRSSFTLSDSRFENSYSDAFDADFCVGKIENSTFENTANDAIDVSGSDIEIINTSTRENGDKGISAGENSRVNLQTVRIENAVIGIASKDLSEVTGSDVTISNSRIGLTLYIKKPEFGPAYINLDDYSISGNIDLEYLIQSGSSLIIDGQNILPRSAAKETLLFEKMIAGEPIQ